MAYYGTSVDVDIDLADVVFGMTSKDRVRLAQDLLDDGYIPDGWIRRSAIDPSDGATLLDVIVELRRMGYTVEPGGK